MISRHSKRGTTVVSTLVTQSLRKQTTPPGTEHGVAVLRGEDPASQLADQPQGGGASSSSWISPRTVAQAATSASQLAALQDGVASCATVLGLTVRPSTIADVARITQAHTRFEMEMAAWKASPTDVIPSGLSAGIRDIIQEEGGERIMLLTRGGGRLLGSEEVIGFVYSQDEVVRTGTSAYVAEVFVEPVERGQGLGDLLVSAALCSALSRGTTSSHLYVCHRNEAAVRLYEKAGYVTDGHSGDATHDLVMRNDAISAEAVGTMVEQRQARQPSRRGRGRKAVAAAAPAASRAGASSGRRQAIAPPAAAATATNGSSAASSREGRAAARARPERDGAPRRPCADLAENVARGRTAPAVAVASPAAAAKPKVWVRPKRHAQPDSLEQGRKKKDRRRTSAVEESSSSSSGAAADCELAELRVPLPRRQQRVISLSGFGTQPARLTKLEGIIRRLGAEMSRGNAFDRNCTHVIVSGDGNGSLRRTEKMLGALAAGRPLLTEGFLEASDAAGAFVDEEQFECRSMFPSLLPMRRALCFAKVCATVLSTGDEKRQGLERILQAGGARIVPTSVSDTASVSHVIVPAGGEEDLEAADTRKLRQLQRQDGTRDVVYDNQLVDYLTTGGGFGSGSVPAFHSVGIRS